MYGIVDEKFWTLLEENHSLGSKKKHSLSDPVKDDGKDEIFNRKGINNYSWWISWKIHEIISRCRELEKEK